MSASALGYVLIDAPIGTSAPNACVIDRRQDGHCWQLLCLY